MQVTEAMSSLEEKMRGTTSYAADLIPANAALIGMARCPHAHARVRSIDASAALAMPGVLGVLVPDDFDGTRLGQQRADEAILARHARYVGDGVAAIAAEDTITLAAAIASLRVEYEVLPQALDVQSAKALATPIHNDCPDNVAARFDAERGDWQKTSDAVDIWVDGDFDTEAVPHAYLEPRATLVRFSADRLELITGNHFPSILQEHYQPITDSWGIGLDVSTPTIGGSFGAKWEHPTHIVCLRFAYELKRDVGMVMSRRDDMLAGRTRLPMKIRMRIGASKSGRILAKETTILADNGAYSGHGPSVSRAASIRMDNLYRFSAVRCSTELIYTNNLPTECFRGFGSPQSAFAQEQLIDELAGRLDMDPLELRKRNSVSSNTKTIHGWQIGSCGIDACFAYIGEKLQQHRQQASVSDDARYAVGYGVAACIHGISNRGYDRRFDKAQVKLSLLPDGKIQVASSSVELGCGTVEVLSGIGSRQLAVGPDTLDVVLGDTTTAPFGLGCFASRTTYFDGRAAIDACHRFIAAGEQLAERLGEPRPKNADDTIRLAIECEQPAALTVVGRFEPRHVEIPNEQAYGNISPGYTFGAHGCCIRIDMRTGKAKVVKYWAAHDAGEIIYPVGARGQVIGGVLQGIGFALNEAVAVDDHGHLQNPGYLDDRVATFMDSVPIEAHFVSGHDADGPMGAKTIAEPPLIPVAACIANAIHAATKCRQYRLPMTPERIWRSMTR